MYTWNLHHFTSPPFPQSVQSSISNNHGSSISEFEINSNTAQGTRFLSLPQFTKDIRFMIYDCMLEREHTTFPVINDEGTKCITFITTKPIPLLYLTCRFIYEEILGCWKLEDVKIIAQLAAPRILIHQGPADERWGFEDIFLLLFKWIRMDLEKGRHSELAEWLKTVYNGAGNIVEDLVKTPYDQRILSDATESWVKAARLWLQEEFDMYRVYLAGSVPRSFARRNDAIKFMWLDSNVFGRTIRITFSATLMQIHIVSRPRCAYMQMNLSMKSLRKITMKAGSSLQV